MYLVEAGRLLRTPEGHFPAYQIHDITVSFQQSEEQFYLIKKKKKAYSGIADERHFGPSKR